MNRRAFTLRSLSLLPLWASTNRTNISPPAVIKPQRLKKGDTVMLVTPGSFIGDEPLQKAIQNLESLGLKVQLSDHIRAKKGYTAGTIEQRATDLHQAFSDSKIKAVWCARGGYGCAQLLPHLDYDLIQRNPKILIGFSDITILLHAVTLKTGLTTFHGPVGSSEFSPYTRKWIQQTLFLPSGILTMPISVEKINGLEPFTIRPGQAQGPLYGGNLTLLASAVGTPWMPDLRGKLVFMEEIGEKPYRIDRMITQIQQGTNIREAAGIVLGHFTDCEADSGDLSLSLKQTLLTAFNFFKKPIGYGYTWGHIDQMTTLPIGLPAAVDTGEFSLTLLESPVI